ncbi:hypothetical protein D3C86_1289900 [compost metagenome]
MARQRHNGLVKGEIGLGDASGILVPNGGLQVRQGVEQARAACLIDARGGQPCGHPFQVAAQRIEFPGVLSGKRHNFPAGVGVLDEQALVGQTLHARANRRAGKADLRREGYFREPGTRRQISGKDGVANPVGSLSVQAALVNFNASIHVCSICQAGIVTPSA